MLLFSGREEAFDFDDKAVRVPGDRRKKLFAVAPAIDLDRSEIQAKDRQRFDSEV